MAGPLAAGAAPTSMPATPNPMLGLSFRTSGPRANSPKMSPTKDYATVDADLSAVIGTMEAAVRSGDTISFMGSTVQAFKDVHDFFKKYSVTINEHAAGLKMHYESLYNAKLAVTTLNGKCNSAFDAMTNAGSNIEQTRNHSTRKHDATVRHFARHKFGRRSSAAATRRDRHAPRVRLRWPPLFSSALVRVVAKSSDSQVISLQ